MTGFTAKTGQKERCMRDRLTHADHRKLDHIRGEMSRITSGCSLKPGAMKTERKTMKNISVKLSDEDCLRVMRQRGNRTTSDYIRDLLFSDGTVLTDAVDFQGLFTDVSAIRTMIEAALKNDLAEEEEHNDTDIRETER
jgi:hypothetical protein